MVSIADFFANLLIACASVAALLTLTDWLASDAQRQLIANTALHWWDRLDEIRRHKRLLLHFRSGRPQAIVISVGQLVGILILLHIFYPNEFKQVEIKRVAIAIGVLTGAALSVVAQRKWILPKNLDWLKEAQTETAYAFRCFGLISIWGLVGLGIGALGLLLVSLGPKNATDTYTIALMPLLSFVLTAQYTFVTMFVVSIASGVGMSVLRGTLAIAELLMRRIAEAPKGPVLALSGLVGGIAALIKAFK